MLEPDNRFSRRGFAISVLTTAGLLAVRKARAAVDLPPTPMQDIGPFYPIQRLAEQDADLTWIKGHKSRAKGQIIEVTGRVLDRHGNPVHGAQLEIWQCNSFGRYAHPDDIAAAPLDPDFQGYAAISTGRSGEWRITTIKPAAYDAPFGRRTPHIHFDVRGTSQRILAQMYFPDEAATNATDKLYRELGSDASRTIAQPGAAGRYSWDIVLMDG